MIPNETTEGINVTHKHYGDGVFKGWYCHYPMIAIVEFKGFTTSVNKEDLELCKDEYRKIKYE